MWDKWEAGSGVVWVRRSAGHTERAAMPASYEKTLKRARKVLEARKLHALRTRLVAGRRLVAGL